MSARNGTWTSLRILAASVVLLGAFTGCGGSSGPSQTERDCMTFISSYYCPKVVACEPPGTVTQADCVTAVAAAMNCSAARGENGQLATCQTDLGAQDCTAFADPTTASIRLPASCMGVFVF